MLLWDILFCFSINSFPKKNSFKSLLFGKRYVSLLFFVSTRQDAGSCVSTNPGLLPTGGPHEVRSFVAQESNLGSFGRIVHPDLDGDGTYAVEIFPGNVPNLER